MYIRQIPGEVQPPPGISDSQGLGLSPQVPSGCALQREQPGLEPYDLHGCLRAGRRGHRHTACVRVSAWKSRLPAYQAEMPLGASPFSRAMFLGQAGSSPGGRGGGGEARTNRFLGFLAQGPF